MGKQGNNWVVETNDSLWSIARSVYNDPYRWTSIADTNGISRSAPFIFVGTTLKLPAITPIKSKTTKVTGTKVRFDWFSLDAGTDRNIFATWSYDKKHTDHYEVKWEYDVGDGIWRSQNPTNTQLKQSSYSAPSEAKKVRIQVKPIAAQHKDDDDQMVYWWKNGAWQSTSYNFSNNPPYMLPAPSYEISNTNVLTVELNNISEQINANKVEVAIYRDDTYKYKTGTTSINLQARYAKFTTTVEEGHKYKVRVRAVRGSIYGGWSDFTENQYSTPIAPTSITTLTPKKISEQMAVQYAVLVEWPAVSSAKSYLVEWATNIEYFDTGQASSQQTEEGAGPKLLVTGIELGHEYFFRVASINDKGRSRTYTPIRSVTLGTRPAAPTTYSNVTSCVLGEDLKLYWVHNSTDGSIETTARIHFTIIDSAHPELQPVERIEVVPNTKPEEERNTTSVYVINTDDPSWSTVGAGYIIKWKVQTAGVIAEYSDWSVEREVNVYQKPEITIDLLNNEGVSVDEIDNFPFYISIVATPMEQIPISYYIEVVSNETYETVDDVGNIKMVSIGDKIYQKYYDPQDNPWEFLLEMTPGNIDLENNVSYTINATVSMNSGLNADDTKTTTVYFEDMFYDVAADMIFNEDTYEVSIHPYCIEYIEENNELVPSLVNNCKLAVYRKEYDGTFTEIEKNIDNEETLYIVDPHPSLDYARYRIVAKTDDTGAISYADVEPLKIGETSIIIQWAEKWSPFNVDDNGDGLVEPPWSGSLIKLPYNISVSDNKQPDVSLVNYIGRQHPVSYYGTHLNEKSTWNVDIPKDDKETLYAIRRLSRWTGDVYVREPSGIGYWANVVVSYSLKYSDLVVPISLNITRVEGGI